MKNLVKILTKKKLKIAFAESCTGGMLASEITSLISEKCFNDLKGPIAKITAPHTPVPFSPPMEDFYIPSSEKIIKAANNLINV